VLPEATEPLPLDVPSRRDPLPRGRAAAEIILCSGYPTQLLIASLLMAAGIPPLPGGTLSPTFVFANLAIDTVLLLALIFFFLRQSGDDPAAIFLGARPASAEIRLGLLTVPIVLTIVVAIQLIIRSAAPSLHNVPESPFDSLLTSRWLLAGFIALLVVAGGVREELQRAFLMHRFEHRLGGPIVGLVVTSVAFGLGHTMQGWDASLATGTLGAFWGVLYLMRRSTVAPIVSHAFFNVVQVVAGYAALKSVDPAMW
jgi:membrane protease YdiL (CAAX protease family)